MLLLIPLGADSPEPRLPRLTLGLLALNVLAFLLTSGSDVARGSAELQEVARVAEYSLRGLPEAVRERAARYASPLDFLVKDGSWPSEVTSPLDLERLTACRADYMRLKNSHPFYRFGFAPAEPSLSRLLTHQFLHADFLHLLFNMLFLWTAGGLVEATLGPIAFLPAYLSCGVAAALTHSATHPLSSEPAIGASGAVAGLMGVCAVLQFRQPIRLALVAGFGIAPHIRIVSLPAFVLLGFWLVEQVFMASFRSSSLNVAFDAHLGGFVFGLALAVALHLLRARRGPVAPALARRQRSSPPRSAR